MSNTYKEHEKERKTMNSDDSIGLIGQIGTGGVSMLIQKNSDCEIPLRQRWSHVAALVSLEKIQFVVESHFKTGGVHMQLFQVWLNNNRGKAHWFYNAPGTFDREKLIEYAQLQVPYGTLDVFDLAFNFRSRKNKPGMHCSELLANCAQKEIAASFKKPFDDVKPIHWQKWVEAQNLLGQRMF